MLSEPEHRITQQVVETEELGIGARLQVRGLRLEKRVAASLASSVEKLVYRENHGPGGWWLLIKPDLHLGEDIVVPDVAGWRRERLPDVPDEPHLELAPDWVCENLSP